MCVVLESRQCKEVPTTAPQTSTDTSLRTVFAGRRGRLLIALLLAEFAAAVQIVAYSSVLPLAADDLDGDRLYGATLTAGTFATIAVLGSGGGVFARMRPHVLLFAATTFYVGGVIFAAAAPAMEWVLLGSILRGLGAGLLAGFGLAAIGGLFEDALRPRVLGLFAAIWVLPSLLGPLLNAAIAATVGWRWALAWPALLVLGARLLMGRDASIIPWQTEERRVDLANTALLLGGLVLSAIAPALPRSLVLVAFVGGLVVASIAALRILRRASGGDRRLFRTVVAFLAVCLVVFSAYGLVPLVAIEHLEAGIVAASVALGAGLFSWSLVGMRPTWVDEWLGDTATLGFALVAAAMVVLFGSQLPALDRQVAMGVLIAGWCLAGVGMGFAYPRLTSRAFENLATARTPIVASAVAFAEFGGSALGSMLGGGMYSVSPAFEAPHQFAFTVAFAVLTALAAGTIAVARSTYRN